MTKCRYCQSTENLTIDHKVPVVQGGKEDIKNLQCLCKRCNGIKSDLSHKQVMRLFQWFLFIEESRAEHGKKTYTMKRTAKKDKYIKHYGI